MLALLCGAPRVDDLPDGLNYTTTSTRSKRRHFSLPQSQGLFRKNSAKVSVSSPSSFRHEFHIGPEVKDRAAQEIWDECRWRQEIQLRIMQHSMPLSAICDPTVTERPTSSDPPPTPKRVSLIKRKPVPVFHADEETLVSTSPPASPRITEDFSVLEVGIAEHPMEVTTQDICPASIPLPPSPTLSTFSLPDPSDHGLPDVIELPEEEEAEPESDPSTHHSGSDSDSFSSCYTPPATPPDAILLTRAPTVAQVTDHMKDVQLIQAEKEDNVPELQKV
ncbi:hypothetical protein BD410DRAFT_784463 [Rickenella mellea]|uniref:CRIB domain-containing protein n=1 Tax=Rickenella mellea TaxID=50990 RepID=A0A4Y7QDL2_9AGAM|nr:hypothetical protein BD410DRAFT_784463 [Rickenella mellea]